MAQTELVVAVEVPVVGVDPEAPVAGIDPEAPVIGVDPEAPVVGVDPKAPVVGVDPEALVVEVDPEVVDAKETEPILSDVTGAVKAALEVEAEALMELLVYLGPTIEDVNKLEYGAEVAVLMVETPEVKILLPAELVVE